MRLLIPVNKRHEGNPVNILPILSERAKLEKKGNIVLILDA